MCRNITSYNAIKKINLMPFIFFLILFASLNLTNSSIKLFGDFSLMIILFIVLGATFIHYIVSKKMKKAHIILSTQSILFILVSVIGTLSDLTFVGVYNIAKFSFCILVFLYLSNRKWYAQIIKRLAILTIFFILF